MTTITRKKNSFIVIDNGLRLLLTPSEGWYAVQGLDIRGLNTQGKTVEEAIHMAHDAAKALEEARKEMAKELAKKTQTVKKILKPRRKQTAGAK